jgi:hypothetical protein
MDKNDSVRLKHMFEAAHACLQFGAGRERKDFEKDQMLSFAVIRALEIFGEAASRVSNEFQKAHPLRDLGYFKRVSLDDSEHPMSICWPNGADICPDYLYELGVELE